MLENPRVALYARISTDDERQNLENQLHQLRAYVQRQNWEPYETEFTDRASGSKDRRPGLDAMLKAAARREFDYVLVFDLSRLTRGGPATAFAVIKRLKDSGVEFWSFREEYFRTPIAGEMLLAIAAFMAKAEQDAIRARVKAGMDRARAMGKHIGNPPAEIDEAKLMQLRAEGLSIRQIAAQLRTSKSVVERRLRGIEEEEDRRRRLARRELTAAE